MCNKHALCVHGCACLHVHVRGVATYIIPHVCTTVHVCMCAGRGNIPHIPHTISHNPAWQLTLLRHNVSLSNAGYVSRLPRPVTLIPIYYTTFFSYCTKFYSYHCTTFFSYHCTTFFSYHCTTFIHIIYVIFIYLSLYT